MSEPHIYVINLKHRTDRKEQFIAAHQNQSGTIHWHAATLGTALPKKTLDTFKTVSKTRKAKAGRCGCYTSHVSAIKKAIKHDHFPLLILEDDAVPTEAGNAADLSELFGMAPTDANLLYFGGLPVRDRKRVKSYCVSSKKGWGSIRPDTQIYGGHAYGFATKSAAQEVLTFLEANRMTFDSALIRHVKQTGSAAIHCPFLYVQSEGYSDIEGTMRPKR